MRIVTLIVLLTLNLSSFGIFASTTTDLADKMIAQLDECEAFSQSDRLVCLQKQAKQSQLALQQAEQNAFNLLSKWDDDEQFTLLAKRKLTLSNEAFAHYRDVHCQYFKSLGGGAIANALEMRRLTCVTKLNYRQADHLGHELSELNLKNK